MPPTEAEKQGLIELARDDFTTFCELINPRWQPARHLLHLIPYLQAVERHEIIRLIVTMPPQHGKSWTTSQHFPAWYWGRHPDRYIIESAYNEEKVKDFALSVDDQIHNELYSLIFPNLKIRPDADTQLMKVSLRGGMYLAVGRGGGATGRPADIFVIDDPYKDREEASSDAVRREIHSWWDDVIYTRLAPRGAVIVIHCLAEGSRIPLADGRWIPIEAVKQGDQVWSFGGEGGLVKASVLKQRLSGTDDVYEIKTKRLSLKANARHPFLTVRKHQFEWTKVSDLRKGDIVATLRSFPAEAKDREPPIVLDWERADEDFLWLFGFLFGDGWVTKVKGTATRSTSYAVCCAMGVYPELNQRAIDAFVKWFHRRPYLTKYGYIRIDHNDAGRRLCDLGLDGKAKTKRIPLWLYGLEAKYKQAFLQGICDADGSKQKRGKAFRLVLVNRELVEDCRLLALECGVRPTSVCVYPFRTQAPHSHRVIESQWCSMGLTFNDTWGDVHLSPFAKNVHRGNKKAHHIPTVRFERIESIAACGESPVYDLTIEHTGNFIAEGFVVHNTRWAEDDMIGWLIAAHPQENWVIVNLPAIAEENDPLGRSEGEPLWPERYSLEELEKRRRNNSLTFQALYQQKPVGTGAMMFKKEWLEASYMNSRYDPAKPQYFRGMNLLLLVDPANSKSKSADYTSMWVLGMGSDRNFYVLDTIRDRLSLTERANTVFRLHKRWGFNRVMSRVGYEQYGLQADIPHLNDKMARENYRFVVLELAGRLSKPDRIARLVGLFENGRVIMPLYLHRTDCDGVEQDLMQVFIEEEYGKYLTGGGGTDHDDMLDSLSRLFDIPDLAGMWPRSEEEKLHSLDNVRRLRDARATRGGRTWMSA